MTKAIEKCESILPVFQRSIKELTRQPCVERPPVKTKVVVSPPPVFNYTKEELIILVRENAIEQRKRILQKDGLFCGGVESCYQEECIERKICFECANKAPA